MRLRLQLFLVATAIAVPSSLAGATAAEILARFDRPLQAEQIALSPDGRHIAYSLYADGKLSVVVGDLQARTGRALPVKSDDRKETVNSPTPVRASLLYLHWATADRLVLEAEDGDVWSVDAKGENPVRLWDRHDDALVSYSGSWRGTIPPPKMWPSLPGDPEHLFLETTLKAGPNPYLVDVRTGTIKLLHPDFYGGDINPADPWGRFIPENSLYIDGTMLYDRQGNPRVQYLTLPRRDDRPFVLYDAGEDPWVFVFGAMNRAGNPRVSLDKRLDQAAKKEFTITPENYFQERSFPVGFDYDPNIMYYASNIGRDTFGIYSVDLKTNRREAVVLSPRFDLAGFEPEFPDKDLLFDDAKRKLVGVRMAGLKPQTAWLDPDLASFQSDLEKAFPRESVEILDWTPSRSHLLLRVASEGQPGRYAVANLANNSVDDVIARAPWLTSTELNPATAMAFESPEGTELTGYLTLPNAPKVSPPPLLIYCPSGVWDRAQPGFNRESQVLAGMGVAVLRLNYRGTAGFGHTHLFAVAKGLDTVPIDDVTSAIEWIAARYKIDRSRIMIMGEGFGGYVALRALQLKPELFRCGISINAPTSLRGWASYRPDTPFESAVRAEFLKLTQGGKPEKSDAAVSRPLLVIEDANSPDATVYSTLLGQLGLGMKGTSIEHLSIKGGLETGTTETREKIFRRIDEFLNTHLYDYGVEIGTVKEVKK